MAAAAGDARRHRMGAAAPASLTVAALLLLACPHGVAALASTAAPASATGALANLVLYGEALCPDTAAWVARVLGPAVRNGTVVAPGAPGGPGALAAARFVGWGKATAAANGSAATCQHGTQECSLNRVLNCAQAASSPTSFLAFLVCYYEAGAAKSMAAAATPAAMGRCAAASGGVDLAAAGECAAGARGAELEAAAGAETLGLAPALGFVPWVTLDGVALGPDCGEAIRFACVAAAARAGGVSGLPGACSATGRVHVACPF